MRPEEAPEYVDLVLEVSDDVALSEQVRSGHSTVLVHRHQHRVGQRQSGQVLDVPGLGGGEEEGLSVRGDAADDAVDGGGEAHVQTPVRLVQHQELEVVHVEEWVLIQVLQESAGSADENVHASHPGPLLLQILATNDQTCAEAVLSPNQSEPTEVKYFT